VGRLSQIHNQGRQLLELGLVRWGASVRAQGLRLHGGLAEVGGLGLGD
jgi:hypothetical protein